MAPRGTWPCEWRVIASTRTVLARPEETEMMPGTSAQKGLIRALAKSAVCLVNLSAIGAKVHGKVTAKEF